MRGNKKDRVLTRARLNILLLGSILLTGFLLSTAFYAASLISDIADMGWKAAFTTQWGHILLVILAESLVFWTGIIMVYLTSIQLGVKMRVIGILCGWIPVVHIFVLVMIIGITAGEAIFEKRKLALNRSRATEQVCRTKYPLLLVHGVFFRDFKFLNYWGRIPGELEQNGATVYYGNHQSAASVMDSAEELARRIDEITQKTGCEKVNVIAHSKGGLDIKTAVALGGMADKVASITTINTPHRGCEFAEYLMGKAPESLKENVADAYNTALHQLGDPDPDFIAAVTDLTASGCKVIEDATKNFDFRGHGIYTQSVGSCMKQAASGTFPLNMSYHLVKYFDGRNDGLVGEDSFRWGEDYEFLENTHMRGISHGDMIDLNRANIPGFDVREFYVQLVKGLKERGL